MTYWTWSTSQGVFRIDEIGRSRIDLLFGKSVIGSYPTPQEAADRCGGGDHARISDEFDGASLGVPRSLSAWTETDANDTQPLDGATGVLTELRPFRLQAERRAGILHLPRSR
jgi:hypothetical protein